MVSTLTILKNSLTQNAVIKIISFFIGYGIWISLAQSQTTDLWLTVPLCFYGTEKKISAPDTLLIHIAGKRNNLYTIDPQQLAIHINTDSLREGPNCLTIKNSELLLPETINLLNWFPSNVTVTVFEDTLYDLKEKLI